MLYTSYFKDINNKLYTIKITTNGDSTQTKELQLSAEPITTTFEGSDDTLYKPVKYSSTTVRILSDNYLFDLYSSKAQQNKVELLDNTNTVRWIGYTTPNLYSQGYEQEFEEIEVECIDSLSTLQYYNYTTVNRDKSIVSFVELINNLLSKCNSYTNYYITNSTHYSENSIENFFEKIIISEENFFDEDGEPMKCDEVLEEICKFLNVTCFADGTNVYFIDYDAIKQGVNTYYKYDIGSTSNPVIVTIKDEHNIISSDYTSNGGTISLDNVYNKAIVKSSLYSFEDAIPDIFDDKFLTNYGTNHSYTQNLDIVDETGKGGKHKCFFRYYKHKAYNSIYYDKDLNIKFDPIMMTYAQTQNLVGATILRGYFVKVDDYDEKISDINFVDYLLLHSHDTNKTVVYESPLSNYLSPIQIENELGVPVFESIVDVNPALIGGDNTYLVFKGSYNQMDRESEMYIMKGYGNDKDKNGMKNCWLKAKLEFNNAYWNGTKWTTQESYFKLEFGNSEQQDHYINKDFTISNNITWDMGLEGEGYAIQLPQNYCGTSKPKLTLYSPHRQDATYRCDAVWLKNFGIEIQVANKSLDSEKNSDTEYSNIIEEEFVNEMDDIEFKICSWDNKAPNYSAVGKNLGAYITFLDTVYNEGTKQTLREEEQLIYRLVNQYSTPSVILELSLKNNISMYATVIDSYLDSDKKFIVDTQTIDWFWDKTEIKIIEKK